MSTLTPKKNKVEYERRLASNASVSSYLILVTLTITDYALTTIGLRIGIQEWNPLYNTTAQFTLITILGIILCIPSARTNKYTPIIITLTNVLVYVMFITNVHTILRTLS